MAESNSIPNDSSEHEMCHHVRDYSRFTVLVKWTAIISFIIAFIVVVFVL